MTFFRDDFVGGIVKTCTGEDVVFHESITGDGLCFIINHDSRNEYKFELTHSQLDAIVAIAAKSGHVSVKDINKILKNFDSK